MDNSRRRFNATFSIIRSELVSASHFLDLFGEIPDQVRDERSRSQKPILEWFIEEAEPLYKKFLKDVREYLEKQLEPHPARKGTSP